MLVTQKRSKHESNPSVGQLGQMAQLKIMVHYWLLLL